MLIINYDLTTGLAKIAQAITAKSKSTLPVQIVFSAAPGTVTGTSVTLGDDAAPPAVLAFTDVFTKDNDTTYTGALDLTDSRLVDAINGKQTLSVNVEVQVIINGQTLIAPNIALTIQPRISTDPTTSEDGPTYYTLTQTDAAIATAVATAVDPLQPAAAQTLSNKTLAGTNLIAPTARVMPPWMVIEGDSLSSAGLQYWPPNFAVQSAAVTTNGDGFNSYQIVYSYTGGTPQPYEVAAGVKPLTSWPEQFAAMAGATPNFYNFAYAGRALADVRRYYWQEAHLTSPRLTGIPKALILWAGNNDASFRTGAEMWSDTQDVIAYARGDLYYPIVVLTILPATSQNAGSTFDVNRLALNSLIAASTPATGGPDIIADVNTVPEVAATNSPTSGNPYTHNNAFYYDGTHPNSAGNAKIAAFVYGLMQSFSGNTAARTQQVSRSYPELSDTSLAAWARRRLLLADIATSDGTGGAFYNGDGKGQFLALKNGASSGDYYYVAWYLQFWGDYFNWNGAYGLSDYGSLDWGRSHMVEFAFADEWAGSGNTYPNTLWQVAYGRANGTHGALAASEYAFAVTIAATTAGQLDVRVVAANGSTVTTSASLATLTDVNQYTMHKVQARSDGLGDIIVTIDGVTTTLPESVIHGPKQVTVGNNRVTLEVFSTGSESHQNYLYFSVPDVSTW